MLACTPGSFFTCSVLMPVLVMGCMVVLKEVCSPLVVLVINVPSLGSGIMMLLK